MNKEKAIKLVESFERIEQLREVLKIENGSFCNAVEINSSRLAEKMRFDMDCTTRAIKRINTIISVLSGRMAIQCKILELDMKLDKSTSQNEEIQLKSQIQILREL